MPQSNQLISLLVKGTTCIKGYINKFFSLNKIDGIIQEKFACAPEANIKEQTSLWISKIIRGLSQDEVLDLYLWSKQSNFHRHSLFSLATLSDDPSVLNELNALFPLEKPIHQANTLLFKYAIAATLTFVLLFTGNFFINITPFSHADNEKQFVETRRLQTEIGQQTRFSLSDGSRIKLNTNSIVKVSFSKKNRLLTLVKGEANFNVAKDKSRPFTVTVGKKSFTALGTIFNVQKTSNENIELVVTEGIVLITKSNEPLIKITNTLSNPPETQLTGLLVTSGEIATIKNNIETLNEKISFERIQRKLAWQQGMLVFRGETLDEALAEVNRYTTTKFELNGEELTKIKVAGYFKANDIDGLVTSLSTNFNIKFEKMSDDSIRLSLNTQK
jgi:transmembrane sensor